MVVSHPLARMIVFILNVFHFLFFIIEANFFCIKPNIFLNYVFENVKFITEYFLVYNRIFFGLLCDISINKK